MPGVSPGNTVYLPGFNEGTLFYTGDCHARQGQGKPCGVALEVTSRVTLTFEVVKGGGIQWPLIEAREGVMSRSTRPMGGRCPHAHAELAGWLESYYGFSRPDAYQPHTQASGLYVGNMVDTTCSLVASVEKRYLGRS